MVRQFLRSKINQVFIPGTKLLVFTFHQSSPVFNKRLNSKYIWSSISFLEDQLSYLKKNFPIVELSEGISELRSGKMKGTHISITFDDGDVSLQHYIVPLFEKLKIPATFFINTAYLNISKTGYWFNIYSYLESDPQPNLNILTPELSEIVLKLRNTNDVEFYRKNFQKIEDLSKYINKDVRFYVSTEFLESLNRELFTLGLHGHEHQRFSMMTAEWQKTNLLENIKILSKLNTYRPIFAIPFGKAHDWSKDTIDICKEIGLEIVFSDGGFNKRNSYGIKRIPADGLDLSKSIKGLKPTYKYV
jgi:peptidoglycan/xylan/chitin deacetylase (PgdA/CDA1 family)